MHSVPMHDWVHAECGDPLCQVRQTAQRAQTDVMAGEVMTLRRRLLVERVRNRSVHACLVLAMMQARERAERRIPAQRIVA